MAGPLATAALMTAAFAPLAARATETCAILYLDAQRHLVGVRHIVGAIGHVDVTVRTIAVDALAFDAAAAVMAHNHPSGDPTPSQEDLGFTRLLARGLYALGVRRSDHVVLARDGLTSLRAKGML